MLPTCPLGQGRLLPSKHKPTSSVCIWRFHFDVKTYTSPLYKPQLPMIGVFNIVWPYQLAGGPGTADIAGDLAAG